MAFRLVVSNTVQVPVKGVIADDAGKPQPFNFTLVCRRMDSDELSAALANKDLSVLDFVVGVVQGWSGVQDGEGQPLAFSDEGLRGLLRVVGIAQLAFQAYLKEVGAKEKN